MCENTFDWNAHENIRLSRACGLIFSLIYFFRYFLSNVFSGDFMEWLTKTNNKTLMKNEWIDHLWKAMIKRNRNKLIFVFNPGSIFWIIWEFVRRFICSLHFAAESTLPSVRRWKRVKKMKRRKKVAEHRITFGKWNSIRGSHYQNDCRKFELISM